MRNPLGAEIAIVAVAIAALVSACGSANGANGTSQASGTNSPTVTVSGNPAVRVDGLLWQSDEAGECDQLSDQNGSPVDATQGSGGLVYVDLSVTNPTSGPVDISNIQVSLRSHGATFSEDDQAAQSAGLATLPNPIQPTGGDDIGSDQIYAFDVSDTNPTGDQLMITDSNTGQTGVYPVTAGMVQPPNQPSQLNLC